MAKVIVVGGVAGGATTASQLRRLNNDIEITIYEKHRDISFANCGLPYLISGEVKKRDDLIAYTKEKFNERNVAVHTFNEVTHVDTASQTVTIRDIENDTTFEESYDYLVLSPGARPNTLEVLEGTKIVHQLHRLEHLDEIMKALEKNAKHATVVGSGFVGLEVAEQLKMRGLDVALLHRGDTLYSLVESEFGELLYQTMTAHGVEVYLNSEVSSLKDTHLMMTNGKSFDTDLILSAIGIRPNTEFLETSDIELDDDGNIIVDRHAMTNIQNVYALGDAVVTHYSHIDERVKSKLAWPAHRMAYLISASINGQEVTPFTGVLNTNIVRVFDTAIGVLGLSIKEVNEHDHFIVDHEQVSNAGYMPNAEIVKAKVYAEKRTGKILRAVFMGKNGVDKNTEVLSAHVKLGGTIYQLIDIEPAYSPPFSGPKSVLNMIGYKAIGLKNN